MIWPFGPRRVEIVVRHEISPETARVLDRFADAARYAAGLDRPPPEKAPPPDEWTVWELAHQHVDEVERQDIRVWFDILAGTVQADEETKRAAAIEYGARQGQYDLPFIEPRPSGR